MPEKQEADDPEQLEREQLPITVAHTGPGILLLTVIWIAWLANLFGQTGEWGLSAAALGAGHHATILLHMFAHAGILHIVMNSSVLLALAAPALTYMGRPPLSWLRFFALYFVSGLAGAALFLLLNPAGQVPMVGASGAISGLIGLFSRLRPDGSGLAPVWSRENRERVWDFIKANLLLIALITVPILLLGGTGGIAWEAHLGGFLVGMFGAHLFLDRSWHENSVGDNIEGPRA